MKKLSISIVALLAIVFAVSSAFNAPKSSTLLDFRIYDGIAQPISGHSTTEAFYGTPLAERDSQTWNLDEEVFCTPSEGELCVIEFDDSGVIDFKEGKDPVVL
jgi:hypothetical protein